MGRIIIPAYTLYGESEGPSDPDFLHIETIVERSSLHGWEIIPHRHHHSIQVLIIAKGAVDVALDGSVCRLDGPCHVTVPVGAVHGFRFAHGTHGWVVTIGQEFNARTVGPNDALGALLTTGGAAPLEHKAARRIALLAGELMHVKWERPETNLFRALLEALLRSLPQADAVHLSADRRLGLFRHLVEAHLTEHRPVGFYAASLGMTVRTLNRLCVQQIGCSPLVAINRRLTSEAQRLLRYTNATVSQISEELGFVDSSYFSRFYLRMTGERPTSARK